MNGAMVRSAMPMGEGTAERSGGPYALAAARALIESELDAEAIVRKSLDIAAEICIYTNRNVVVETV